MKQNDYMVVEHKTLNSNAEDLVMSSLGSVKAWAKRLATKNNKVYVVVRVVSIVLPEEAAQQSVQRTGLGPCEEEGCKKPAVVGYCEDHM